MGGMEGVAEIGETDLLDEICADRDRDSPRGQMHDFRKPPLRVIFRALRASVLACSPCWDPSLSVALLEPRAQNAERSCRPKSASGRQTSTTGADLAPTAATASKICSPYP